MTLQKVTPSGRAGRARPSSRSGGGPVAVATSGVADSGGHHPRRGGDTPGLRGSGGSLVGDPAGVPPPAQEEPRPRWWLELVSIASLYGLYTAVRGLKSDNLASADATGRELLRLENLWHLNPEHTLNDLLAQVTALAVPACYFYATLHYILTPAVLIWMYGRRPAHYRVARSTILLATILGLVGFWLLPTTPPRLLDGAGYHDTMAEVSSWGWWGGDASAPRGMGGLTNQYAAMPSLHCGW